MALRRKSPAARTPRKLARGEQPPWQRTRMLGLLIWENLPWLRLPLSVLAVVHLVLVVLIPTGQNALLGLEGRGPLGYFSLFQVEDATGFALGNRHERFFLYRIYTQGGEVVEDHFPNFNVTPRLRLERWIHAIDRVSGPRPEMHQRMLRYILEELPAAPMRLDLFAARWRTQLQPMDRVQPSTLPPADLELTPLGSYDGLSRTWKPQQSNPKDEGSPQ